MPNPARKFMSANPSRVHIMLQPPSRACAKHYNKVAERDKPLKPQCARKIDRGGIGRGEKELEEKPVGERGEWSIFVGFSNFPPFPEGCHPRISATTFLSKGLNQQRSRNFIMHLGRCHRPSLRMEHRHRGALTAPMLGNGAKLRPTISLPAYLTNPWECAIINKMCACTEQKNKTLCIKITKKMKLF